ncbi:hypothetical protein FHU10_1233 [Serratia fonticola]|uniref:Uncharacterized protein n=1 Tax=Serratia fonticola TaxID=47917 RepID=A0A559T2E3_SERFO|nr:hypothetical protein FHU09_1218 [Serratia fonticola]TQI99252.1 hypothetical protein FHU11_4834 [Serratia fonticola]TVZ68777.1 hypothetical protein FHU10_1233 [Serratia fonticola]
MHSPIIDSVESLNAALLWHVPNMRHGFIICTYHGEINVLAEDAQPFVEALESLLQKKIALINAGK